MTLDILLILATIYLLLPVYLANMAPVIVQRLGYWKQLAKPIDGGLKLFGQDLLGKGKTWRGLIIGVLVAMITVIIQTFFQQIGWLDSIRLINYWELNYLLFGFLAGLGALGGDLVKSFIKRRVKITSGNAWPVFDQLDFIVGFFLLTWLLVVWTPEIVWAAVIITLAVHPVSNLIGYYFKIKKVWW